MQESAKQKDYAERMDAQGGVQLAVNTIAENFAQDTTIPLALYFPNRRMSVTSVCGEENAKRIEPTTLRGKQMPWQGEDIPIPEARSKLEAMSLKGLTNWFHH